MMVIIRSPDVTKRHLADVFRLRAMMWRRISGGQVTFPSGGWFDDYDEQAVHWVVLSKEKVIASARATLHDKLVDVPDADIFQRLSLEPACPIASLNRMVVHFNAAGQGISGILDTARLQWARSAGCRSVLCICSEYSTKRRLADLMKLGFAPVGEINGQQHWDDRVTALYMRISTD